MKAPSVVDASALDSESDEDLTVMEMEAGANDGRLRVFDESSEDPLISAVGSPKTRKRGLWRWVAGFSLLAVVALLAVPLYLYVALPHFVATHYSLASDWLSQATGNGTASLLALFDPDLSTSVSPESLDILYHFIRTAPPRDGERGVVKNMTLLSPVTNYRTGMMVGHQLFGTSRTSDTQEYMEPMLFHVYWLGPFLEKHVVSIQSCWLHHMKTKKLRNLRRIVMWTDAAGLNDTDPAIMSQLTALEGVEMRLLQIEEEAKGSPLDGSKYLQRRPDLSYYSDVVRYCLLHRYGGVWFDLDVVWLRPLDPLLVMYDTQIMVYTWEDQPYPNGAIFISLQPRSLPLTRTIQFIAARDRGFGFHEAELSFDLPLDLLVLPCAWFDAGWQDNPLGHWSAFSKSRPSSLHYCTWDNFHAGAFAYHWHNQWNEAIQNDSCMRDLQKDIQRSIALVKRVENTVVSVFTE